MVTLLISLILAGAIAAGYILKSLYSARGDTGWTLLQLSRENGEPEYVSKCRSQLLTKEEWSGFIRVWQSIRAHFDRDPQAVVIYADVLISDLVTYADFCPEKQTNKRDFGDSRLNDKYRVAHEIARSVNIRSPNLDELRQAMSLYASLFDEFLFRAGRRPEGQSACGSTRPARR